MKRPDLLRHAAKLALVALGAALGIWHLLLAGRAIFVFHEGEHLVQPDPSPAAFECWAWRRANRPGRWQRRQAAFRRFDSPALLILSPADDAI
jgi:hypothetical protein